MQKLTKGSAQRRKFPSNDIAQASRDMIPVTADFRCLSSTPLFPTSPVILAEAFDSHAVDVSLGGRKSTPDFRASGTDIANNAFYNWRKREKDIKRKRQTRKEKRELRKEKREPRKGEKRKEKRTGEKAKEKGEHEKTEKQE